VAGGVVVVVRLTPKGGRDAIEGIEQLADGKSALKARVRAASSDGEANEALMRLIADGLDVGSRQVSLLAGATAWIKRLMIEGNGTALIAVFERLAWAREDDRKDH
jgi:uncharacterized protein